MNNLISKIVHLIIIAVLFSTVSCKKKDKPDLSKAFVKYYGGINGNKAVEVLQTSDGGYVIAGTSNTGASSDIIIIKTDAQGNQSWQKTFGGANYDECGSVAIMPDGGYILIGTYGKTSHQWDVNNLEVTKDSTSMYAIRLDASGNTVWEKKYPPTTSYAQIGTFGKSVVVNSTGECLLAGMIDSSYTVAGGNLLINLDLYAFLIGTDGNLLKVLNPATSTIVDMKALRYGTIDKADITFNAIKSVNNNEYIISTSTILSGQNTPRLVSCKLSGITLAQNNAPTKLDWAEPTMYDAAQVSKTYDGNYILTGTKGIPPNSDIYLIKLTPTGITKISSWDYGDLTGSDDEGVSAINTTDGGYALLGTTNSVVYTGNAEKLNDVILIKVDPDGTEKWNKVFGGRGDDFASRIIQTTDGGYLICGTIAFGEQQGNTPGSSNSITLIKVDSEGDISNTK